MALQLYYFVVIIIDYLKVEHQMGQKHYCFNFIKLERQGFRQSRPRR